MDQFENHLSNGLIPQDFHSPTQLFSTSNADYFRIIHKSNTYYYKKTIKNNEIDLKNEIIFLNKLGLKPRAFPEFYGYYKEYKANALYYSVILEYIPYNLGILLDERRKNNEFLGFSLLKDIYSSILNGMTLIQAHKISPNLLNPMILALDETQNVKFLEIGTFITNPKQFITNYTQQIIKAPSHYSSPENQDFYVNAINPEAIDPYKSEAFAFGQLILELGTMKTIKITNNYDILQSEIESFLKIFHDIYSMNLQKDEEKSQFLDIYNTLIKVLHVEIKERWDFIDIFKNRMLQKEKIIYHILLEESSIGEIEGIDWKGIKRRQIKKIEVIKDIKSIFHKEFQNIIENRSIKLYDQEGIKGIDRYLIEGGIEGISLQFLNKDKGNMLILYLCELLKVSKSIKNVALWGNDELFEKEVIKALSEALKLNKSVNTLNLGDNGLGSKKKGVKFICKALQLNDTLTYINLGGNKIGISHKNMKPIAKMLKKNKIIDSLGLGSNAICKNSDCLKILLEIVKNNKNLKSLSIPNNGFGDNFDAIKGFSEVLLQNKTLTSLNFEHNRLGCNYQSLHVLFQCLKSQNTLIFLDIGNNFLGEKSTNFEIFAEMLKFNKTLKTLGISNNKIGSHKENFMILIEGLKENVNLETIDMETNGIEDIGIDILKIEEIVKRNKNLVMIALAENGLEKNKEINGILKEIEKKYGVNFKI